MNRDTNSPSYEYESDFDSDFSLSNPSSEDEASDKNPNGVRKSTDCRAPSQDTDDCEWCTPQSHAQKHAPDSYNPGATNGRQRQKQRYVDILSKVSFNDISIDLYEWNPNVDTALERMYFGTGGFAKFTQTEGNCVACSTQTTTCEVRSRGTQFSDRICTALWTGYDDQLPQGADVAATSKGTIEQHFARLEQTLSNAKCHLGQPDLRKLSNVGRFLKKHLLTIQTITEQKRRKQINAERRSRSVSYDKQGLKVIRMFDSPSDRFKVLLTQKTTESEIFTLLFLNSKVDNAPLYTFRSWTSISTLDWDTRNMFTVFGGTKDGSLLMWIADRKVTDVPPRQVIAPQTDRALDLKCNNMVAVKILPVTPKDGTSKTMYILKQIFTLYATGIVVIWHLYTNESVETENSTSMSINAQFKPSMVSLVQSKLIDAHSLFTARHAIDDLTYYNSVLINANKLIISTDHTMLRVSYFLRNNCIAIDSGSHMITSLRQLPLVKDTLFMVLANKTVLVLKLSLDRDLEMEDNDQCTKTDSTAKMVSNICSNKSCTIQSIVFEEQRYFGSENGRADSNDQPLLSFMLRMYNKVPKTRFHHRQQIMSFYLTDTYDMGAVSQQ